MTDRADLADLVASALVGVARRPPTGGVQVGGRAVDGRTARTVLDAAGLHAVARRAGRRPDRVATRPPGPGCASSSDCAWHLGESPPAGASEPDSSAAPEAASQLLELALGQSLGRPSAAALVGHWISNAASSGYRAPHRLLVALLELQPGAGGTPNLDPDPDLVAVLGRRGRWLAQLNPAWSWIVADDGGLPGNGSGDATGTAGWATADRATRRRALQTVRRRDPAAGRMLVGSTWGSDSASDREQHLRTLAPTLEPDDEALLMTALDDRSRKVRAAAIELLASLPDSAWVGKQVETLRPLIGFDGRLRKRLSVALPSGEGELGDPPPGASRRAHHLELLVAMAPLSLWTEITGWSPSILVAKGAQPEVLRGWIAATVRQGDPEWAAALLAEHHDPALVAVLGHQQAEPLVERALRSESRAASELPFAVGDANSPWSPRLSAAVVERLRREQNPATFAREHTTELGARLDSSVIADLQRWHDGLGDQHRYLALPLRAIIQHVSIRTAISEAFADPMRDTAPMREGPNR